MLFVCVGKVCFFLMSTHLLSKPSCLAFSAWASQEFHHGSWNKIVGQWANLEQLSEQSSPSLCEMLSILQNMTQFILTFLCNVCQYFLPQPFLISLINISFFLTWDYFMHSTMIARTHKSKGFMSVLLGGSRDLGKNQQVLRGPLLCVVISMGCGSLLDNQTNGVISGSFKSESLPQSLF